MSDLAVHIRDEGVRDRIAVVFLHAFPMHSAMWAEQERALVDTARCVSFDVRGSGQSPMSSFPSMLDHYVDDLFAVLDHLQIQRAVLCGLSMGGYVALRAVEREPQRVSGLLLADTQAGADTNEAKLKRADGIRKLMTEGTVPYVDAFLKNAMCAYSHDKQPHLVANARHIMLDQSAEAMASALMAIATRTDTTSVLSQIKVPTRLIVGEQDAITGPDVMREMARKIAGSDFHVLPNAGHMSNLEAAPEFNSLLIDHVRRVAG